MKMEKALNNRSTTSLADKLPPQNLEAERACLGSMLMDREAIEVAIELLRDEDFYSLQHKIIYGGMLELYNRSAPVDIVTLNGYLKDTDQLEKSGGVVYVSSLLDEAPTSANIEYYAKIIEQKSLLRKLIAAASSIIALSLIHI